MFAMIPPGRHGHCASSLGIQNESIVFDADWIWVGAIARRIEVGELRVAVRGAELEIEPSIRPLEVGPLDADPPLELLASHLNLTLHRGVVATEIVAGHLFGDAHFPCFV